MLRGTRFVLASAALAALLLVAGVARAQLLSASVTRSGQLNPDRIVNGQNLGQSERPQNLNPVGVSYSDCTRNMTLRFYVNLSGFTGQNLQIWATRTGDCTAAAARGVGTPAATCWLVNGGLTAFQSVTNSTQTFDIRVQDLIGPQTPPTGATLVHEGSAACSNQSSYAAVALDLWFLPLDSGNNYSSGGYDYSIQADLQGPPAPSGINLSVGDTLFLASWSPNVDTDTIGYDVYIDPIPGAAVSEASVADVATVDATDDTPLTILVCPETGASSSSDGSSEGGDDGSADAMSEDGVAGDAVASDASDASQSPSGLGCYTKPAPPPPSSALDAGSCGSSILAQGYVAEGGSTTTAPVYDDAGNLIDDGGTVSGSGGISQIPAANLVGANGTTSMTISDKSVGAYTITGLTNGPPGYTIAISAVDGFGNIGPPSVEKCDFPAPVNDFFKTYRLEGGRAGGGFCTLEAVGAPVDLTLLALPAAAAAASLARRRRRRKP